MEPEIIKSTMGGPDKNSNPDKKDNPTPPEVEPIREPDTRPEVQPSVPNPVLPGKEDIPSIKAFVSRYESGYW